MSQIMSCKVQLASDLTPSVPFASQEHNKGINEGTLVPPPCHGPHQTRNFHGALIWLRRDIWVGCLSPECRHILCDE